MSNAIATRVGAIRPKRNVFDLSYRTNFTCDMGQLIPVMCDEVVPGDYFKVGAEATIRFQPLATPIMHEIRAHIHYFFVPYRILYRPTKTGKSLFEDFIAQGQLGGDLPIKLPTFDQAITDKNSRGLGSLWDYFGLPVSDLAWANSPDQSVVPLDIPWRAYNRVYNEYYRDQDLQSEVGDGVVEDDNEELIPLNTQVLNRNWAKDYFTSARPWRQKGTAPALPVDVSLNWTDITGGQEYENITFRQLASPNAVGGTFYMTNTEPITSGNGIGPWSANGLASNPLPPQSHMVTSVNMLARKMLNKTNVPHNGGITSGSTTFDVSDLRLAFQTQKWLERNARAGTRYTEFLRAHFGVAPSDSRLDRPEYIGGLKMPVMVSEVLQTSETTQTGPLGAMGGHGLAADGQFVGDYNVPEYGLIIGIMSVMPKPAYQQGINRQWLRQLPTDFYFPEFCRLSEQGIYQEELWHGSTQGYSMQPRQIFGFCGQYDEMRVKHDLVCGEMRKMTTENSGVVDPLLSYWNMARFWNYLNDGRPLLNSEFITCRPRKDIFLVPTKPGLIVNVQNNIKAVRPLPLIADPGLVDHY